MPAQPQTYQQSHHRIVTAAHSTRTAAVEGAFILPHLQPHFAILDIGCGPGTITSSFATYVPQGSVTGIDTTEQVISEASERLSQLDPRPKNVAFEVGNVLEGLRWEDGTFDVVFCSQTLIHIVEPVKALREMRRLCKPGGFVAAREADMPFRWVPYLQGLQLFNKYLYRMVMGNIGSDAVHPDNAPFEDGHRSGSLVHVWAREAGFDPLRMVKGARTTVYGTLEERMYCRVFYFCLDDMLMVCVNLGKFHAGGFVGRIENAGWREKFVELGASEEEVDTVVSDLKKWEEDVDGWHAIVQCETICWK